MPKLIAAAAPEVLSWPVLALLIAASAGWDCYTGTTKFGAYLTFDTEDSIGPFIIWVGLKFVLAILILAAYYGGA